MAPVVPNPAAIKAFRTEAAFSAWLEKHHASAAEVWLRVYKKDSGVPSITIGQALDVVLCWGWIDGIRKAYDDQSYLQRYTPRRPKSVWSQINRDHIARLTAAGRMTPHGQRQVDAARADGRWDAAYAPMRSASTETVPDDLRAAIEASPEGAQGLPNARPAESLRPGLSHEQHEDAGRPREEDCRAGGDARARRDDLSGAATLTGQREAADVSSACASDAPAGDERRSSR